MPDTTQWNTTQDSPQSLPAEEEVQTPGRSTATSRWFPVKWRHFRSLPVTWRHFLWHDCHLLRVTALQELKRTQNLTYRPSTAPPTSFVRALKELHVSFQATSINLNVLAVFSGWDCFEENKCFWMHLPSWRRALMSPFCHSFNLLSKWVECSFALLFLPGLKPQLHLSPTNKLGINLCQMPTVCVQSCVCSKQYSTCILHKNDCFINICSWSCGWWPGSQPKIEGEAFSYLLHKHDLYI